MEHTRHRPSGHGVRALPAWVRPCVDGAMTAVFLLQMVPGHVGNTLHELAGISFAVLFVLHHLLNRGWLRRLGRGRNVRARVTLASDVALTCCVVGLSATGVLMSRSAVPWLSVPSVSHVVRPLHGMCAYCALMLISLHVGLHLPVLRRYLRQGSRASSRQVPVVLLVAATLLGLWAGVRLGVMGKLLGRPSFPDGVTPLPVLLAEHLALALPFVLVGAMIATAGRAKRGEGHE